MRRGSENFTHIMTSGLDLGVLSLIQVVIHININLELKIIPDDLLRGAARTRSSFG